MKKLSLSIWIIATIATFTLSSCLKDNDEVGTFPKSTLTMVNGYSASEGVYYTVDENNVQTFGNPLQYKQFTYANLFPGNRRIRVKTIENNTLVDSLVGFSDSTYYTSFVYSDGNHAKHILSKDIINNNTKDSTVIRFLHLSPNIANVNIYLGDKLAFSNRSLEGTSTAIAITEATKFKNFNSGNHQVVIKDAQQNIIVERTFNFLPNRYYSIILIGDKNNSAKPPYLGIVSQY